MRVGNQPEEEEKRGEASRMECRLGGHRNLCCDEVERPSIAIMPNHSACHPAVECAEWRNNVIPLLDRVQCVFVPVSAL